MQTSEFEYYLIQELVTMPDRVLAQQIELMVWAKSPIPNEPILQKFVDMLQASDGPDDFANQAREYIKACPVDWTVSIVDSDGKEYAKHHAKSGFADFTAFGWDTVNVMRNDRDGSPLWEDGNEITE